MPNPEPLKALEKAWKSPDIGKHGKRKKTLKKEELREQFMQEMGGELETITNLLKVFIDRLNTQGLISNADIRSLMDLLEQLIGSAQKSGDTNISVDKGVFVLPSEAIIKYKLNEPVERI